MPERREPNERKRPELAPEDWQAAVTWRPYIYQLVRKFGSKVMGMDVWLTGDVMRNTHQWITSGEGAYGVDAHAILEDLEARAFEAAAVAAHHFDENEGFQFTTYLTKVVNNQLQDEFDHWVKTSSSKHEDGVLSWQDQESQYFGDHEGPEGGRFKDNWDPQYEKNANPYDPTPEGVILSPEVEAALERAMGALSSKEAWALRMHADGVPVDVIRERLGYKGEKSVYKLIATAKTKARAAYEEKAE